MQVWLCGTFVNSQAARRLARWRDVDVEAKKAQSSFLRPNPLPFIELKRCWIHMRIHISTLPRGRDLTFRVRKRQEPISTHCTFLPGL